MILLLYRHLLLPLMDSGCMEKAIANVIVLARRGCFLLLGPQLVRVFFLVDVLIVAVDFLKPSFRLQMGVDVGSSV